MEVDGTWLRFSLGGRPLSHFFQRIMIFQKTWPPGVGASFPYMSIYKTENLLLQNDFCKYHRNNPWVDLFNEFMISQKSWPPGALTVFLIWLYRKL